jgi:hypothetical protein
LIQVVLSEADTDARIYAAQKLKHTDELLPYIFDESSTETLSMRAAQAILSRTPLDNETGQRIVDAITRKLLLIPNYSNRKADLTTFAKYCS